VHITDIAAISATRQSYSQGTFDRSTLFKSFKKITF